MRYLLIITFMLTHFLMISCGGKEEVKKEKITIGKNKVTSKPSSTEKVVSIENAIPASKKVDLSNKGVGPIKSLVLEKEIDKSMAAHGGEVFKKMCMACHRPTKKFIGPAPIGLLERRTPEWIMNMILNPEEMVKNDPLARELLIEFNGSPMANQNLSEKDARAVLEYFRTL